MNCSVELMGWFKYHLNFRWIVLVRLLLIRPIYHLIWLLFFAGFLLVNVIPLPFVEITPARTLFIAVGIYKHQFQKIHFWERERERERKIINQSNGITGAFFLLNRSLCFNCIAINYDVTLPQIDSIYLRPLIAIIFDRLLCTNAFHLECNH